MVNGHFLEASIAFHTHCKPHGDVQYTNLLILGENLTNTHSLTSVFKSGKKQCTGT